MIGGLFEIVLLVEQRGDLLLTGFQFALQTVVQVLEFVVVAGRTRFGNRFTPLHLCNEKIDRHRGVLLVAKVVPSELEQVAGSR